MGASNTGEVCENRQISTNYVAMPISETVQDRGRVQVASD